MDKLEKIEKLTQKEDKYIKEINELHHSFTDAFKETWKTNLVTAITIGGRLLELRQGIKHGEWLPFLELHFPFTERTAQYYMKAWDLKDSLKNAADCVFELGWVAAIDSLSPKAQAKQALKLLEDKSGQKSLPRVVEKEIVEPKTRQLDIEEKEASMIFDVKKDLLHKKDKWNEVIEDQLPMLFSEAYDQVNGSLNHYATMEVAVVVTLKEAEEWNTSKG